LANCDDGAVPAAPLIQSTNGRFYGTTSGYAENSSSIGTIFRLTAGLGPFVTAQPISGKVGATIEILGYNLKSTTAVEFDGTPATFKIISVTKIAAVVPAGGKTGYISVIAPARTLESSIPFRVTP
jgi:hypothetical protein